MVVTTPESQTHLIDRSIRQRRDLRFTQALLWMDITLDSVDVLVAVFEAVIATAITVVTAVAVKTGELAYQATHRENPIIKTTVHTTTDVIQISQM